MSKIILLHNIMCQTMGTSAYMHLKGMQLSFGAQQPLMACSTNQLPVLYAEMTLFSLRWSTILTSFASASLLFLLRILSLGSRQQNQEIFYFIFFLGYICSTRWQPACTKSSKQIRCSGIEPLEIQSSECTWRTCRLSLRAWNCWKFWSNLLQILKC